MNPREELKKLVYQWMIDPAAARIETSMEIAEYLANKFSSITIEMEESDFRQWGSPGEWQAHLKIDHNLGPVKVDNSRSEE